mgnify:FL=1
MKKRALLVIDLQNGVGPLIDNKRLIDNVNCVIDEYHQQKRPIIFIQHQDNDLKVESKKWQLVSELHARPSDYYVRKIHADSFYKTNLAKLLAGLGINQLEICGAEIPFCIDATIKAAFDRKYQLFMRHGMVSTEHDALIADDVMVQHYEQIWDGRFVTYLD